MDARECRDNARRCYRQSQTVADANARQALLDLMVKWHELADWISGAAPVTRSEYGDLNVDSTVDALGRRAVNHEGAPNTLN